MYRVYKYQFKIEDEFHVYLPLGFQILKVECQNDVPCMWALVNPESPKESVRFRLYGTGHDINVADIGDHVATFQQGRFVWHLFRSR